MHLRSEGRLVPVFGRVCNDILIQSYNGSRRFAVKTHGKKWRSYLWTFVFGTDLKCLHNFICVVTRAHDINKLS